MSKKKDKRMKYLFMGMELTDGKAKLSKTKIREEDWEREDRRQRFENDNEARQYEYD